MPKLKSQQPEDDSPLTRQMQILQQLAKYHKSNPEVFDLFCQMTLKAIASGRRKFSAHMIVMGIRWNSFVKTDSEFKINNLFFPYFARMFMLRYPEHQDIFSLRRTPSQNKPAKKGDGSYSLAEITFDPETEANKFLRKLLED